MNILKWFKKNKPQEKPKIVITEGIGGTWFYHLSYEGKTTRSLCGKQVMQTNCSLKNWGYVGHLNERYCEKCEKMVEPIKNFFDFEEAKKE